MSDNIRVNTEHLNRWASELSGVASALSDARSLLSAVNTGEEWWTEPRVNQTLRFKDAGSNVSLGNARSAVSAMLRTLNEYKEITKSLGKAVRKAGGLFDEAEDEINATIAGLLDGDAVSAGSAAYNSAVIDALGYPQDTSKWSDEMKKKYADFINNAVTYEDENGNTVFSGEDMVIIAGASGALSKVIEYSDSPTKAEVKVRTYGEDGSYTQDTVSAGVGSKNKEKLKEWDPKFKEDEKYISDPKGSTTKRKNTYVEVSAEAKSEMALAHDEAKYDGKHGKASASYDVGYAEAHAGVHAGLYRTEVSADGKKHYSLEPGVSAEIGISTSVAQAEASGRYGNDYAGISGKVEGKVLSGEAEASTQLGIVDGEVAAHAKVSAEYNLAEASGSVGVDVVGIEGKVTGEVSVGIGAHAEVGYHDGTFVADIGVAIGVGGSVRVEVDVQKFADNVISGAQGFCESAADFFGDLWKK